MELKGTDIDLTNPAGYSFRDGCVDSWCGVFVGSEPHFGEDRRPGWSILTRFLFARSPWLSSPGMLRVLTVLDGLPEAFHLRWRPECLLAHLRVASNELVLIVAFPTNQTVMT